MVLKLDVLIVQIFHVLLLVFLFNKFFGKALADALLERKEKMKQLADIEQTYNAKMSEAEAQAKAFLHDAKKEKDALINEGMNAGQRKKEEIILDAEREAERIKTIVQQDLEGYKKDLEKEYDHSVRETAYHVVKKLIGENKTIEEAYIQNTLRTIKS